MYRTTISPIRMNFFTAEMFLIVDRLAQQHRGGFKLLKA